MIFLCPLIESGQRGDDQASERLLFDFRVEGIGPFCHNITALRGQYRYRMYLLTTAC